MNPSLRALLVAVPFVAAYFVMRSLPVTPCDFLHEETYNAEGVVDYCGGGDSAFVDLSHRASGLCRWTFARLANWSLANRATFVSISRNLTARLSRRRKWR